MISYAEPYDGVNFQISTYHAGDVSSGKFKKYPRVCVSVSARVHVERQTGGKRAGKQEARWKTI